MISFDVYAPSSQLLLQDDVLLQLYSYTYLFRFGIVTKLKAEWGKRVSERDDIQQGPTCVKTQDIFIVWGLNHRDTEQVCI